MVHCICAHTSLDLNNYVQYYLNYTTGGDNIWKNKNEKDDNKTAWLDQPGLSVKKAYLKSQSWASTRVHNLF